MLTKLSKCKTCHHKIRDYCPKALSPNIDKSIKGPGATFPIRPSLSHRQGPYPASFVPSTNSIPPERRSPVLNSNSSRPVVHAGIICDACSKTIHGVRHKCLDCRGKIRLAFPDTPFTRICRLRPLYPMHYNRFCGKTQSFP